MDKGFSLVEIVIGIAIAGVLLAIATNSYQVAQIKKQQNGIIESIYSSLQEQRTNSQTGKNGEVYGVKFNQTDFTLFTGSIYSDQSLQNKVIAINSQFEIQETISNPQNTIYFSKINGSSNQNATITISHITNRIEPKSITIENSGTISVVE